MSQGCGGGGGGEVDEAPRCLQGAWKTLPAFPASSPRWANSHALALASVQHLIWRSSELFKGRGEIKTSPWIGNVRLNSAHGVHQPKAPSLAPSHSLWDQWHWGKILFMAVCVDEEAEQCYAFIYLPSYCSLRAHSPTHNLALN